MSARRRAWVSWSSGKDSAWALGVARRRTDLEIVGLMTTINEAFDRVAMHAVRADLLRAQAAAVGLPVREIALPWPCSNAEYEARVGRALEEARREGIEVMVFGDLFLEDVRRYRERQLSGTGIEPLFPLWGEPTPDLIRAMIDAGVRAHIVTLDPRKVPRHLAGRVLDHAVLAELPADVDPCGENGELHTFVSAGPMLAHPLEIEIGETVERDGFVFTDLQLRRPPGA